MNVRPLNDRILVKPAAADKFSAGGIQLAVREQAEPSQGHVVASYFGSAVLPGERVVFARGKHPTTTVAGVDVYVLREDDLMAVLED